MTRRIVHGETKYKANDTTILGGHDHSANPYSTRRRFDGEFEGVGIPASSPKAFVNLLDGWRERKRLRQPSNCCTAYEVSPALIYPNDSLTLA
jgi:hypothetical protein